MNKSVKVFNGKAFAKAREPVILDKVTRIRVHGITPKLAIIICGSDEASRLYVSIKQKTGERLGIEVEVIDHTGSDLQTILRDIARLNGDDRVHGIMVQLPLSERLEKHTSEVLDSIAGEKDVDGLRTQSHFVPATVKAVFSILSEIKRNKRISDDALYTVLGSKGIVGSALIDELTKSGFEVDGFDIDDETEKVENSTRRADVLISATGIPGLVTKDMVKKGAIVIDIGSPKGDVDLEGVIDVASYITPVPGGVGPVTVISLFENLLIAVASR